MFSQVNLQKGFSAIRLGLILMLLLSLNNPTWAGDLSEEQDSQVLVTPLYLPMIMDKFVNEASGVLDPSFDRDGRLHTNFGLSQDYGNGIAVQPDGKILVAGQTAQKESSVNFAVVRYNLNGSLDRTFDGDGKVVTDIAGDSDDSANAVVLQPDGKIVVVGSTSKNGAIAIVRYNSDGSLDTGFDEDGIVKTDFTSGVDIGSDIALQADGKIVVAGYSSQDDTSDFLVARYNSDGSLDNTFGTDGVVLTDFNGQKDYGYGMALQADGKIVVVGSSNLTSMPDFAVARYNPDGSLDSTFDSDGRLITDFNSYAAVAYDVALQPDGKIIVVGIYDNGIGIARYNSDGSLDVTFDDDGKLETFVLWWVIKPAVVLQQDGKIVVTGEVVGHQTWSTTVIRYNPDGSLDDSFDGDGIVITDVFPYDLPDWILNWEGGRDVALQADGKIVVAGYADRSSNSDFTVLRYNPDGSLDDSFSGDGIVLTNLAGSQDEGHSVVQKPNGGYVVAGTSAGDFALVIYSNDGTISRQVVTEVSAGNNGINAVALQRDESIIVTGFAWNGTDNDFALARYKYWGSLDTTFDGDGLLVTDIAGFNDQGNSLIQQSDGMILVVGVASNGANDDFAIVRYKSDGSLDGNFADGGILRIDFAGGDDAAQDVVLQPDGRIIVVGSASDNFAMARINPNGSLDSSFGVGGKVVNDIPGSNGLNAMALQQDGKIVAVGSVGDDIAVVRYNADGILDNSFSVDGLVATTVSDGPDIGYDVVIQQANGKIIVAGCTAIAYAPDSIVNSDFIILRYNPDGSLDTSFAADGILVTAFDNWIDVAFGVLLQSDSRIVVAGFMENGMDRDFALARYK
jgi:uncharacterized delta-60 repeat protein